MVCMSTRRGILHLRLFSHSLHSLSEFYSEVLGLEVAERAEGIRIQAGTTRIDFHPCDPDSIPPVYHLAFNIPENKFRQAKQWLSLRTALLSRQGQDEFDFRDWNAQAFYFEDPGGNILELIARHELDNASQGPFTPQDILNASEIGLPVDDVIGAASEIESCLGLPRYRAATQEFATMGDEHRLLILVRQGHTWWPTSSGEAQAFPLTAELQGERPAQLQLSGTPFRISVTDSADF